MPKTRAEIDKQFKWQIEDIYATNDIWEADYKKLQGLLTDLPPLEQSFTTSAGALYDALKQMEAARMVGERLYVYAKMRRDEDNAECLYQGMTDRAMSLNIAMSSALAFVRPALLQLDQAILRGYMAKNKDLNAEFNFMIENLLRNKPHVLGQREEQLLSMSADFAGGAQQIFTMLNNADMRFGNIDDDGKEKELSHASYAVFMQSANRQTRKNAYDKLYSTYKENINTIAATYATSVKKDVFYASARGFDSALSRALHADNVPLSLYDNLIESVHDNLGTMYDYVALRKKVMGIDDLAMYDVYAPLVPVAQGEYPYDVAKDMVKTALQPLGQDYAALLDKAYNDGWIDVFENQGKLSGAYSWGTYAAHPFVLLNHKGDLNSVYTLAHELGHAMHTWHANSNQPYAKSDYTIFVAEVASTVNEVLLTKHLLATETDVEKRKYILNHYIDQFKGTVVRQTMFAEFEKITHAMQESGEPLTAESLNQKYLALNQQYFGDGMTSDENIAHEWARIPHFYRAFYVYQYATGFACAIAIAEQIIAEGEPAVKRYKAFLSSGGSDYPIEQLKIAGVDIASGQPVKACMQAFKQALADLKALY